MKLFNENEVDLEAYHQGEQAWKDSEDFGIKFTNPYVNGSDKWFSWNKGWNSI